MYTLINRIVCYAAFYISGYIAVCITKVVLPLIVCTAIIALVNAILKIPVVIDNTTSTELKTVENHFEFVSKNIPDDGKFSTKPVEDDFEYVITEESLEHLNLFVPIGFWDMCDEIMSSFWTEYLFLWKQVFRFVTRFFINCLPRWQQLIINTVHNLLILTRRAYV